MKNDNIHRSRFPIILSIGLLLIALLIWQSINGRFDGQAHASETSQNTHLQGLDEADPKQKGAHVFGRLDSTSFQSLDQYNLEWITMVTWCSMDDFDSPAVRHHRGDSSRMLKRDSIWTKRIESARASGFKVFFKPHIWIDYPTDGKWRSDIFPSNEENWELWKESYREYIIRFARIAEQAKAEMYCIGAELTRLAIEKPAFWRDLIQEVRSIYSGKITYAANWHNEYEQVTFWEELDYIGIQAYFPLVKNENPSVEQISKGWNKYLPTIESIHRKYNRKVLFTELGYKSTTDGAIKPWEWIEDPSLTDKSSSVETQANCYEAFFSTVWDKEWFAGVHLWSLHTDYLGKKDDGKDDVYKNLDFTPQGKQAEFIIAKGFE